MNISKRVLLSGAIWNIGSFGLGQMLRLASSIVLARLLAPNLFGLMLIINTLRTGIELISDIGITQNIIYSDKANEADFYNTAWTVQLLRSLILWIVFVAVAIPMAHFYNSPILALIIPISGFGIVLGGFTSVAPSIMQKRLQFGKFNMFLLLMSLVSFVATISIAYFSHTIWALVYGGLISSAATMVGSYYLLPNLKQRFYIHKEYLKEILNFGKWIFLSSIVFFLSTNFDRLYFAKAIPLEMLGIYGIARSISDILSVLAGRLGGNVIFPFVASHLDKSRDVLRDQLSPLRAKFLLGVAFGCSLFVSSADLAVKILYDQRYQAASWMLAILVVGSWFSILTNINESTLLGFGKPSYTALANSIKFAFLLVGLPISLSFNGLLGGVIVVTLVELCRYIPIYFGQKRERISFGAQDLATTLAFFFMIALWEWLRWILGFGTSFDSLMVMQSN